MTTWSATADPTATLDAFTSAWNKGDRAAVLATFEADRRSTIDGAPVFGTRLAAWKALHHRVEDQCNTRGAFYKTAVVTYQDRRSGAGVVDPDGR